MRMPPEIEARLREERRIEEEAAKRTEATRAALWATGNRRERRRLAKVARTTGKR